MENDFSKIIENLKFVPFEIQDKKDVLLLEVAQDYPAYWDGSLYYRKLDYFDAQKLCIEHDLILATSQLEDMIAKRASILLPASETHDKELKDYIKTSDRAISFFPKNRLEFGIPSPHPLDLVAGHKRIFALSRKGTQQNKVCTFGAHGTDLSPQKCNYFHDLDYYDCSLSARFIKNKCILNDKETTIKAILKSKMHKLISNEMINGL